MKRNKKLFAILTLVAFMMTLMPVMAFAATTAVTNNGVTFEVKADGSVDVVPTNVADYVFSVASDDTTDVSITVNRSTGTLNIASVSSDTNYYGSSAQASDLTGGAGAGADITNAPIQISKSIKDLAATEKAAADFKTTPNLANARTFLNANLVAATVENADQVAIAKGFVTAGVNTEADKAADVVIADLTTSVKPTVASGYTATIDSVSSSLDGIIAKGTGLAKEVSSTVTGTVTIKVTDDAYKGDDIYGTKTINVTVQPTAGAMTTEAAKNILNGQSLKHTIATTSETVAFNPGVSGVTLSIYDYSSGLNTAMKNATVTGASFGAVNTSEAASGTVTIMITKAGQTAQFATINLSIGNDTTSSTSTSVDASIIATKDENASIEAEASANVKSNVFYYNVDGVSTIMPDTKYAEIELVLRQANNASISGTQTVYVWAEESGKSRQATDALKLNMGNQDTDTANQNVYKMTVGSVSTIQAAFVRAGSYNIKASIVDPTTGMENGLLASNTATFKTVTNKNNITATALAQETRLFTVKVASGANADNVIDASLIDGEKSAKSVAVSANTVATTKVTLTVKNKSGSLMSTYPIKLSTNSGNIELDKTSITTDYKGEATFNIAGLREGEYKVYVNIGDYEATILVQVGATSANSIELIKFPSNPIATDTMVSDYKDVFRFQLTDANGNIVKDTYKGAEYAALVATDGTSSSEQAKYAYIVSAPEANKVKNADLKLKYVSGKDYYTLDVDNNKSFSAEGDYEVRVVLNNGKSATLNFTVKKFDTAVSLHIEYPTQAVELNSKTDAPDIYFLDANNVMKKANNRVTVAASGYAVAGVVESGSDAGTLTVKNDEKYIGQTITVTAASDKENLMATTTLTVADEAREVKLDSTRGQVNANNRVGFKVVDSTGKAVALGNDATVDVTAVVTNTGDADAKVSYSVSGSSKADLKSNGTGVINLSSNKETTATVQIMVKVSKPLTNANDNNTGLSTTYYSGTETFTFGAEADKSVVMTIGSKELVANNVPVATDVAPFIKDNRTWVPFRALTEAFGAEVDYNAENNTVTTKLNGKTVVLTVGSTVLTVNDEAVTMDVAPYIVDDRVVVPVRFVGEAFGFTVEATQDETGATASVVFYQK